MTHEPSSQDKEGRRMRYDNETILVEEDDVEAHGMLAVAAAVVIMAGSAGGTMIAHSGTALAPEPAFLTAPLDSTNMTAAAYYVNTGVPTSVVKWSSSYNPGTVPAGTPCSPFDLAPGTQTAKVIVATGNYRKCM
jgi:hypothetical protein